MSIRIQLLDELKEHFDADELLDNVVLAMSDADFKDIYDHIKRMWGIGLDGN